MQGEPDILVLVSVRACIPPILPPQEGFLFLDREKFAASFAADVKPETAAFMADSQVPWGPRSAWRDGNRSGMENETELVSDLDRRPDDPPDAQRFMAERAGAHAVEVQGRHAVYVSQPQAVADLIQKAAVGASQSATN